MKKIFYISTFILLTSFVRGQSDASGQKSLKVPHLTKDLPHEDRIFAQRQTPDHTKFDSTIIGKTIRQAVDLLKIDTTFISTFCEPEGIYLGVKTATSDNYQVTIYFTESVAGFYPYVKPCLSLTIGSVCVKDKSWKEKCWHKK